jgi:hypothetical protein
MVDQSYAKNFFIDQILKTASEKNIDVTEPEKYMLRWSESDDDFVIKQDMIDKFNQITSDEIFEEKIEELIKEAYKQSKLENPNAKQTWINMYKVLCQEDHYILVMINEALANRVKKWFFF